MKIEERSWVTINLDNFEYNIKNLKPFFKNKDYLQIVKADAYGHGAYQIALKAIELGASFLGVANYQEALLLRFQKISLPILILSPSLDSEIIPIIDYNLTPSVQSYEFAEKLNYYAAKSNKIVNIHINVDTGMGRSGFYYKDAYTNILKIKKLKNINIEGIFSHYAASEDDLDYSKWQFNRFKKLIASLPFSVKYLHTANSSGVVNMKEEFTNLVRLGLLSFGIYSGRSLKKKVKLKTVMSFFSKIGHIKIANKGESIGYNRTFIAQKKIRYAILPVGYADGYDFLLSNKGVVLINGKICKVLGKISMDMIAVDITELEYVKVGDIVQLIGFEKNEIKPENLTALYNGSSYELLCQIGRRAKRYYIYNNKIIDSLPLSRRNFVPSDFSIQKLNNIIKTAITHRIKSEEISSIIYKDFLQRFFMERDKNINYREDFNHIIEFKSKKKKFYEVYTTLQYKKVLNNDFFYVKCAKNEKDLEKFFEDPLVEYRWLLDGSLKENYFKIQSVKINDIDLQISMEEKRDFISIKCYQEKLNSLIGEKVTFFISTITYYPISSHQLSVYINQLTKNVKIKFIYNSLFESVEVASFFSGNNKFPIINRDKNFIEISGREEEWIFPHSGVVFSF